jgi:hypothetical protein
MAQGTPRFAQHKFTQIHKNHSRNHNDHTNHWLPIDKIQPQSGQTMAALINNQPGSVGRGSSPTFCISFPPAKKKKEFSKR